jgi:hypothetical protein
MTETSEKIQERIKELKNEENKTIERIILI